MREQLWSLVVGAEELLAVRLSLEQTASATWFRKLRQQLREGSGHPTWGYTRIV